MCGKGLKGSTLGIFGLGNIGQAIAKRLQCFELDRIIYNDIKRKSSEEEGKIQYVEFEELLKESDYIICCCAATEETHKLFNKDVFNKMKKTAIFVNISRGTVVDQDALYDALLHRHIQAAGCI